MASSSKTPMTTTQSGNLGLSLLPQGAVVRTEFPDGGTGEVVEVDFDRIGVKLVSISYTQLKLASTANEHQSADEALDLRQRSERTFVTEEEESEHYMGAHWDMFFNEPKEAFKQLPEIVPQADGGMRHFRIITNQRCC